MVPQVYVLGKDANHARQLARRANLSRREFIYLHRPDQLVDLDNSVILCDGSGDYSIYRPHGWHYEQLAINRFNAIHEDKRAVMIIV